ncbi:MAG TPA: hypothetical protein VG325_16425 [Solirubrobacteraceae bacterium]|nr:hypothetical protein [Solirubrobacteraceae bacterium]
MNSKATITVMRPREEVERLWHHPEFRTGDAADAGVRVRFVEAPGDRGTEIHVELEKQTPGGKLGEALARLTGTYPLAKVKDDLRRFKQRVETGVIAQSDAVPEGELAERKFKQRPAQPLSATEMQKAGV